MLDELHPNELSFPHDQALSPKNLFEGFVVYKARSILWYIELTLLKMLAEFPGRRGD